MLMDVQMPEMDGCEATGEIRRLEVDLAKHTPIIAMTAHAMEGDRERCMAAGMDDYVTKPINTKEFLAAIARWKPKPETRPIVSAASIDSNLEPVFSIERLDESCGGDEEFRVEVIVEYLETVPGIIRGIGGC